MPLLASNTRAVAASPRTAPPIGIKVLGRGFSNPLAITFRRDAHLGGELPRDAALVSATASALSTASSEPRRASDSNQSTYSCSGQPAQIFSNFNDDAVDNGGTPPSFTTDGAFCLTEIETRHWNGSFGAAPGTLGLTGIEVAAGLASTVGPFDATGNKNEDTVWVADVSTEPSPTVIDGTYQCDDSDPSTWSQNSESGGLGFCLVDGVPAVPAPPTTTTTTTTQSVTPTTTGSTTTTTTTLPSACKCATLKIQVGPDVYTSLEQARIGQGDYYWAVLMPVTWTMTCTPGEQGDCSGDLTAIVLDNAVEAHLLVGVMNGPDGEPDPATGKALDGLTAPCKADCTKPAPGHLYLEMWVPNLASAVDVKVQFKSTCADRSAESFDVKLSYPGGGGVLDPKESDLGPGAPKPVPKRFPTPGRLFPPGGPVTYTENPCKCATVTLQAGNAAAVYGRPSPAAPRGTKWTAYIWYTLTCTGGPGKCTADVSLENAEGPGTVTKPSKDYVLHCQASCTERNNKSTGNLMITIDFGKEIAKDAVADKTITLNFIVICVKKHTIQLRFEFDKDGSVVGARSKLSG